MEDYIERVSSNVNIEEGPQAIENLLLEIYFQEGISSKELSRKTLLPVPIVSAIKKEFIKAGIASQDRGVRLTAEGKAYVENYMGFFGINLSLYSRLMKNQWDMEKDFKKELEALEAVFNERPQVDVTVDQSKCTVETSIKRAVLCMQYHSLIGKEILCVGDDDLVSISLGFLIKKLFNNGGIGNTHIHIVDIDKRFLEYIEKVAQKENLPVECHYADLKQPLVESLQNKFDCFFTDPPYTIEGMSLFMSRGISSLKKKIGQSVFLSFSNKAPNFSLEMQKEFIKMGLMTAEIIPRFNRYEGAEIIGNTGQMLVLKTTSETMPVVERIYDGPIYTGEIKKTVRIYRCKNCGKEVNVGFNCEYRTIEALKNTGCQSCGSSAFDLISKTYISEKE
jgi:predicted methyltransferase